MNFDENQKFSMWSSWPMTLNKMAASMPKYEIWAHVGMVPYCITAHRSRSSQVDMLCTIDRYRLCELHARDVTARDSFTAQSGGFWICVSNSSGRTVSHACVTTKPFADGRQVHWQELNIFTLRIICELLSTILHDNQVSIVREVVGENKTRWWSLNTHQGL